MTATSSPLSGDRCRCTACGRPFTSTSSFEKHRITVTPTPRYARRCMTDEELAAAGMVPNDKGFLRVPMSDVHARFNSPPRTTT